MTNTLCNGTDAVPRTFTSGNKGWCVRCKSWVPVTGTAEKPTVLDVHYR